MANNVLKNTQDRKAYIITGPTSGIGRATALELAKHGTVVLVGRNREKLSHLQKTIENMAKCRFGGVRCFRYDKCEACGTADHSASASGGRFAQQCRNHVADCIAEHPRMGFVVRHQPSRALALTEALAPHLLDGVNVVFIVSAIEDPSGKPVEVFRNGGRRDISAEAQRQGEWENTRLQECEAWTAYSTSKQCCLAARAMALARENPRLRINAIDSGIVPGTGLGGDGSAVGRFIFGY